MTRGDCGDCGKRKRLYGRFRLTVRAMDFTPPEINKFDGNSSVRDLCGGCKHRRVMTPYIKVEYLGEANG